jgi:hypothetical protein
VRLAVSAAALIVAAAGPRATAAQSAMTAGDSAVRSVDDAILARRLAAFGRRTRSAMALVAAAQMLLDLPARPLDPPRTTGGDPTSSPAAPADTNREVLALLTSAQIVAPYDEQLGVIVRALRVRATAQPRGAGGGPRERQSRVPPNGVDTYSIAFRGGEPAVVYVTGDGQSNLDLTVFDPNGRRIGLDAGPYDEGLVRWTPRVTGNYRVEVRNLGKVSNGYVLITN